MVGGGFGGGGGGKGLVSSAPRPPPPAKQKSGLAEPKTNSPPLPLARFGAEQKNTFTNVFDNSYDIGDFRSHYASE